MINNILILKEQQLAIKVDSENKDIFAYDIDNISGEVNLSTEGILREINSNTGNKIESEFNIDLKDYNVVCMDVTVDTDIRIRSEL